MLYSGEQLRCLNGHGTPEYRILESGIAPKEEKEDSYDSFEPGSSYDSCEPSSGDEDVGSSSNGAEEIQKH